MRQWPIIPAASWVHDKAPNPPFPLRVCFQILGLVWVLASTSCGPVPADHKANQAPSPVQTAGTIEVTARLLEIPDGAIFQRELYDYATVLKYKVLTVRRGSLRPGEEIYVGQYNPWKPRAEAADKRVKDIGGTLRQFEPGQVHHLALEPSMEEQFMRGVVDKYFGQHTGPTYWAVWTDPAK